MVTRRKRAAAAIEEEPAPAAPAAPSRSKKQAAAVPVPLLKQVRDCWEFAALGQFLFIFGPALKIPDSWNIEILEGELLGDIPAKYIPLVKIALLRNVSSHKGVTEDQFEEYTRRQYLSRKPSANPFGDAEEATKFSELDVLTRIKVLYQLSQWALIHPERLRERLEDVTEKDQQEWRVEPCGYDAQSVNYILLDDNRLYRRTEMVVPETTKPAKAAAKKKKTSRPYKRRRLTNGDDANGDAEEPAVEEEDPETTMVNSMKWSCACANMEEYVEFINKLKKSKNADEKELCNYLVQDVMPVLESVEEEKRKEEIERQRKLAIEAAVANRKRSSRIDAKLARRREEEEKAEQERQRLAEIQAEKEAAARAERIGRERESRLAARERRLRERELRLARKDGHKDFTDESDSAAGARKSTRRLELEAKKRLLDPGTPSEWVFDCICGVYGTNYDDGTPQVACDRCEVWQHVACLNLSPGTENKEFVCDRCLRRQAAIEANPGLAAPRITIKLKVSQPSQTQSTPQALPAKDDVSSGLELPEANNEHTHSSKTTLPLSPRSNTNNNHDPQVSGGVQLEPSPSSNPNPATQGPPSNQATSAPGSSVTKSSSPQPSAAANRNGNYHTPSATATSTTTAAVTTTAASSSSSTSPPSEPLTAAAAPHRHTLPQGSSSLDGSTSSSTKITPNNNTNDSQTESSGPKKSPQVGISPDASLVQKQPVPSTTSSSKPLDGGETRAPPPPPPLNSKSQSPPQPNHREPIPQTNGAVAADEKAESSASK